MGRLIAFFAFLALAGCNGDRAARIYAREAGQATQEVLHLDSFRSSRIIGDCLASDPTRRVNLIDLRRKVRDEAAGATYDRVLLSEALHVVVRIIDVPLGSIVTAHVKPGRVLSPFQRSRIEMCAGKRVRPA